LTADAPGQPISGELRVSVIIPTWNEEQRIGAAIRSAQLAGADEVIVADGGSTDQTCPEALEQEAIVISASTGRAHQCNAGAAVATGDVLLFLHADCLLHPESIGEIRKHLAADQNAVFGGFRQSIDGSSAIFRLIASGNAMRIRTLHWVYGDQALFVRADLFRELGGFPSVALMEDLLLSRLAARRGRTLLLDPPLVVSSRRWNAQGVVRQTLRNWSMVALLLCGVSPDALARHYPSVR